MKKWERYIFWAVTSIVALIFAWGLWVTNCVFSADKKEGISQETVKSIQKDTTEMKKEMEGIKQDVKDQGKVIEERHRKMMELLLEINKNVK